MSLDANTRRAIGRVGSALRKREQAVHRIRTHKGYVYNVNDDGTVDILIPPDPDPGDGSGDLYPNVHALGSYTNATAGDNVVFQETGPGKFFCLGKSIGPAGGSQLPGGGQGGSGSSPQTTSDPYQTSLELEASATGSGSNVWYPRVGVDMTISAWRITVKVPSISSVTVELRKDGITMAVGVLPATQKTVPLSLEAALQVRNGEAVDALVSDGAGDAVGLVSILDVQ